MSRSIVTLTELTQDDFGFSRVTHIESIGDRSIRIADPGNQHKKRWHNKFGCVYLWLAHEKTSTIFEVIYVGKAGGLLFDRIKTRNAGFSSAEAGNHLINQMAEIRRRIVSGEEIQLWARHSDPHNIFGVEVSACASEEAALCARFRPILNGSADMKESRRIDDDLRRKWLARVLHILDPKTKDEDVAARKQVAAWIQNYGDGFLREMLVPTQRRLAKPYTSAAFSLRESKRLAEGENPGDYFSKETDPERAANRIKQDYRVSRNVNSPKHEAEVCAVPIKDEAERDSESGLTPDKVRAVQAEARKEGQRQRRASTRPGAISAGQRHHSQSPTGPAAAT